jgi:hypothetical protein
MALPGDQPLWTRNITPAGERIHARGPSPDALVKPCPDATAVAFAAEEIVQPRPQHQPLIGPDVLLDGVIQRYQTMGNHCRLPYDSHCDEPRMAA